MKRNKRIRLTAWISGVLVTVVIGCGGPGTVTPQDGDNEHVDATETAKSDVTTDSSSQENANVVVDTKPKEVATAKSAPTETTSAKVEPKPVPPPSFQQVVDVLDLRTAFDILPNAGEINRDLTSIYYSAPATVEQAVQSYTKQLTSAGWVFEKEVLKNETAQMSYFLKDGFRLMLRINRGSEEGHVGVSLGNSGPVSPAALPHPDSAILDYEIGASASYIVTADLLADAGFEKKSDKKKALVNAGVAYLRSELAEQGWTEYRENFSVGGFGNDEVVHFMQKAAKLTIYVRPRKNDEFSIDYTADLVSCGLSVVGKATKVTFDDSFGLIKYNTDASAKDVIDHHRRELAVLGWKPMQEGERFSETGGQLVLEREGDKCVNVIALRRQQGGADVHVSRITRSDAAALIKKLKAEADGT